jgi:hypothetical protein|tara:strand:+ start:2786 stop:3046 length:261 start_codon:yes stop_codon:yes gene_type:complete
MDLKIEKTREVDMQIDIQDWMSEQVQQSDMWEINNPRVKGLMRAIVAIVADMDSIDESKKLYIINTLFGLVQIYGDKDFGMSTEEE